MLPLKPQEVQNSINVLPQQNRKEQKYITIITIYNKHNGIWRQRRGMQDHTSSMCW